MNNFSMSDMLVVKDNFEKEIAGYTYQVEKLNHNNYIYIIEDSLILLLSFVPDFISQCTSAEEYLKKYNINSYLEEEYLGDQFDSIKIEELTPNEIGFKINATRFSKSAEENLCIKYAHVHIRYERFQGYKRKYWCVDEETTAEFINRTIPQLHLRQRYDLWEGVEYKFIVFEIDTPSGDNEYAVLYTSGKIQTYINKVAKEYIKTGIFSHEKFNSALNSWKGVKRKVRLEEHLKYCSFSKRIKEKDDVWRYANEVLTAAYKGKFDKFEKSSYVKPINKWITEELVYNLVKRIYKGQKVIYQHRPFFLKSSSGGQMSYDVFIAGLNIAIEYQGKQHFEPVDFFGGEEAFKNLQKRDQEKIELSKQNGIKLLYINYWEDVTPELIKEKISSV